MSIRMMLTAKQHETATRYWAKFNAPTKLEGAEARTPRKVRNFYAEFMTEALLKPSSPLSFNYTNAGTVKVSVT